MKNKCYSKDFGKKEKVINYACQAYQLSRPNKVGAVMALIRECQPKSIEEWEKWYFEKAYTDGKTPVKVTKEVLKELGERLHIKITEIVIPEWQEAFRSLTLQDCVDYISNLTIFGNYSATERMKVSFRDFEAKYGDKVFVVFSIDDEIKNTEALEAIEKEISRLRK